MGNFGASGRGGADGPIPAGVWKRRLLNMLWSMTPTQSDYQAGKTPGATLPERKRERKSEFHFPVPGESNNYPRGGIPEAKPIRPGYSGERGAPWIKMPRDDEGNLVSRALEELIRRRRLG